MSPRPRLWLTAAFATLLITLPLTLPLSGAVGAEGEEPAEPTVSVRGTVTLPDGSPAGYDDITLMSPDQATTISGSTDEDGGFRFLDVTPGDYILRAVADTPPGPYLDTYSGDTARLPDAAVLHVEAGVEIVKDLHLLPAAAVRGRVLDPSGRPVQRWGIVSTENTGRLGYASESTDANGWYTARGLAGGRVKVSTSVMPSELPGTPVYVTAVAGRTVTAPVITLPAPGSGTIRGVVHGVPNARTDGIRMKVLNVDTHRIFPGSLQFDDSFEATVPPGRYRVFYSGSNVATGTFTLRRGSTYTFRTLTIPEPTTVRGKITLSNGAPAVGVNVKLLDSFGTSWWWTRTSGTGRYEVQGAGSGAYTLVADAPRTSGTSARRSRSLTISNPAPDVATANMRLPRGYSVSGIVRADGVPVTGVRVRLLDGRTDDPVEVTTGSNGRFLLRYAAPGTWTVRVSDPYVGGYRTATLKVTVTDRNLSGRSFALTR